jgi:hypothetical protein
MLTGGFPNRLAPHRSRRGARIQARSYVIEQLNASVPVPSKALASMQQFVRTSST